MHKISMSEKEFLHDALTSQKFITGTYNSFANECATPNVRNDFIRILNEEHQIQADLFNEMHRRGWYETKPAQTQQITQAKQKYQNMS